MTKHDKVASHLKAGKSITSWEAIQKYRATRLSSIIHTLRNEGWNIKSEMLYDKKSKCVYAKYSLQKKKK